MKHKLIISFFIILKNVLSLIPRCNITSKNVNYFIKNKQRQSNKKYRIRNNIGDSYIFNRNNSYLFINTPSLHKTEYRKYLIDLNSDDGIVLFGQDSPPKEDLQGFNILDSNGILHEFSNDIPDTDSLLLPNTSYDSSPYCHPVTTTTNKEFLQKLVPNIDTNETNKVVKYKLVPLDESKSTIDKFLSKIDFSSLLRSTRTGLNQLNKLVKNFIYPKGASREIIRFTNFKILERVLLSLSSAIALNIRPFTLPEANDFNKGLTGFIKNKISGTRMTTLFLTNVFKDVFSRVLNYYWFNKSKNVSEYPKLYRVISTMGYSLFSLSDFFVNLFSIEPKPFLLAFSNVIKQLFVLTHNYLNQQYYNNANMNKDDIEPLPKDLNPNILFKEVFKTLKELNESNISVLDEQHNNDNKNNDGIHLDDNINNNTNDDYNKQIGQEQLNLFDLENKNNLFGIDVNNNDTDSDRLIECDSNSLIVDGVEKPLVNTVPKLNTVEETHNTYVNYQDDNEPKSDVDNSERDGKEHNVNNNTSNNIISQDKENIKIKNTLEKLAKEYDLILKKEVSEKQNQNNTVVPYKDESVFLFDLVGMSLGMYVSYLLNKYNSNALKIATILSNLTINNILTGYMTTLVDK